jgi:uncharacterized membrane protein
VAKLIYQKTRFGRVIGVVVSLMVLVGVGVAARRGLTLGAVIPPVVNPKFGPFDASINEHALLTWLHIIPGTIFLVLGPFQFVRRLRARHRRLHRWSGRVYLAAGFIIGITALFMSVLTPIGGLNETMATMLFAFYFLFALTKAFIHILRRQVQQHREWMIRAFAIGLAIATVRPIVALFFVFSGLSPHEFFGTAFWLGFTLHLIAAEVWINYTRRQPLPDYEASQAAKTVEEVA